MTTIHVPDAPTLNEYLDDVAATQADELSTALALYHPQEDNGIPELLETMGHLTDRPRNSLRAIVDEVLIIDAVLEATGGELTPELEAKLDAVNVALAKKADGVRDYLAALDADATILKAEEQRLAVLRKQTEARIARFERYVLTMMQRMGTKELVGQFGAIKRKLNPPAVEVVDAGLLPSQFRPEEVVVKIDKTAIKKAITAAKSDTLYAVETYSVPTFDEPHGYVERGDGYGYVVRTESQEVVRVWAESDIVSVESTPEGSDIQLTVTYRKPVAKLTRSESLSW